MTNIAFSSKIAISKRRSTTAFDRYNFTILEVISLSVKWEPTQYGPDDFFPIFDAVFSFDPSQPGWNSSTQFSFLRACAQYLASRIRLQETTGADEGLLQLRSLF